eukprot:1128069-Pelagomonas_calceolata.AAC.4
MAGRHTGTKCPSSAAFAIEEAKIQGAPPEQRLLTHRVPFQCYICRRTGVKCPSRAYLTLAGAQAQTVPPDRKSTVTASSPANTAASMTVSVKPEPDIPFPHQFREHNDCARLHCRDMLHQKPSSRADAYHSDPSFPAKPCRQLFVSTPSSMFIGYARSSAAAS